MTCGSCRGTAKSDKISATQLRRTAWFLHLSVGGHKALNCIFGVLPSQAACVDFGKLARRTWTQRGKDSNGVCMKRCLVSCAVCRSAAKCKAHATHARAEEDQEECKNKAVPLPCWLESPQNNTEIGSTNVPGRRSLSSCVDFLLAFLTGDPPSASRLIFK